MPLPVPIRRFVSLSLAAVVVVILSSTQIAAVSAIDSNNNNDGDDETNNNNNDRQRPSRHVLFVIAMGAEATPFIEHFQLQNVTRDYFPTKPKAPPFHAYEGYYDGSNDQDDDDSKPREQQHRRRRRRRSMEMDVDSLHMDEYDMIDESLDDEDGSGCKVTVVTNGKDSVYGTGVDNAATVPAAMATYLALLHSDGNPPIDLVINAGTCGGFQRMNASIGDVFLTTGVAYHDRRIPIPGFDTYGMGQLHAAPTLQQQLRTIASRHDYKTGICTTGNSLDKTEEDDKYMSSNQASVKDMEAAAVAWSCKIYDSALPYVGLKVVTDIVDGDRPTQDEFLENLHTASRSLQAAIPTLLDDFCSVETKTTSQTGDGTTKTTDEL